MAGSLWMAKVETPARDDLSLENDIRWPASPKEQPEYAFYENPDGGVFVCDIFLKQKPTAEANLAISKAVGEFLGLPGLVVEFSEIQQQDWIRISLDMLSPVEAGRFFVHGSHHTDKAPPDKVPILIDASLAFGTGHHETTRGCLLALEDLAGEFTPETILDLGTGSGILAIAAAKIWPKAIIVGGDNDPKAIEKAKEFSLINDAREIEFVIAGGFDHKVFRKKTFDLMTANILAGPLIDLADEIKAHLNPEGRVVLAGLLDTQKDEVLKAYRDLEFRLLSERTENEWPVLVLEKP